jgi:signal transduction histidine kinase
MCSLMLLDPTGEWLDLRAHHGAGDTYVGKPRLHVGESLLGIVVRRCKPLQLENVQISGRYQNVDVARREGLVSLLAVPLLFQGRATGTLNVYTDQPHTFSDEEVRTLAAYAELSALALERARLYERLVLIEEELRQSERLSALGLLAAEIAHEIRNPLTVMKMLHHTLNPVFAPTDPRSTDFRLMGDKMDHLNRIVDRVLDFARTAEPKLVTVNLNQLIEDMALLLRAKLRGSGVMLVKKFAADLPEISADATQLEQAFLNLALNAIEAMPEGGQLTIRSRPLPFQRRINRARKTAMAPTHVMVRFRDTGVGMSPEQAGRVFTSLLSSTKPKGTGIGMAIVSRVVDAHQGVVRVKSALGRGTAFTIILPVKH